MAAAAREKFMAMQAEQQPMLATRTPSTNSINKSGGKAATIGTTAAAATAAADPLAATLPVTTASPTPVSTEAEAIAAPQVHASPVVVSDTAPVIPATPQASLPTAAADPNAAIIALGWQVHNDKKSGRDYYYNPATKETKWQRPAIEPAAPSAAADANKPAPATAPAASVSTSSVTLPASAAKNLFESKAAAAAAVVTIPTVKTDTTTKPPPLAPASKSEGVGNKFVTKVTGSPTMNKEGVKNNISNGNINNKQLKPSGDAKATPTPTQDAAVAVAKSSDETAEQSTALKALLEQNRQLQAMIAAGMNGPIALDFGGKLDALTRTNAALTIQINRLQTEHTAMLKALTESNVKVHQLQQQIEEERAINSQRLGGGAYASSTAMSLTKDGEATEVGVLMSHLRETNRNLVQQVGELSTLLARSLADQSFVAAASIGQASSGAVPAAGLKTDAKHSSSPAAGEGSPPPPFFGGNPTYYPGYQALMQGASLGASPPLHQPSATSPGSPLAHRSEQLVSQQRAGSYGPPFPQSYLPQGANTSSYNAAMANYNTNIMNSSANNSYRPQYEGIYDRQHRSDSANIGGRRSASPPYSQQQQQQYSQQSGNGFNHPVLRSGSAYGTRSPSLGGHINNGNTANASNNGGSSLMFGGFVIRTPAGASGR